MNHESPCWGGHNVDVTCQEAEAYRAAEAQQLWHCGNSPSGQHTFMGGTSCANGCGRYVQELMPDENFGDET